MDVIRVRSNGVKILPAPRKFNAFRASGSVSVAGETAPAVEDAPWVLTYPGRSGQEGREGLYPISSRLLRWQDGTRPLPAFVFGCTAGSSPAGILPSLMGASRPPKGNSVSTRTALQEAVVLCPLRVSGSPASGAVGGQARACPTWRTGCPTTRTQPHPPSEPPFGGYPNSVYLATGKGQYG